MKEFWVRRLRCANETGDVRLEGWVDLFDVVVVGAGKPAFLGDGRRDMLRVDAGTNMGTLHNFVGKPVSEVGGPAFLQREGKIFQSGADSASVSDHF